MNPPSVLVLLAAFALAPPAFPLHLEPVRNDSQYPRDVVDIEDADHGVVAQLFVMPGETMKLDSKENPAAGAGYYQALPGEVYYVVILPTFPLPRLQSNLCPCLLHVDKIGWNRDGSLSTIVGFRPYLLTAAGAKIPIVSDVNHPRMDHGRLYFRLQGHGGGDYWVLTRFGQVVDVGGPWGPWELILFLITRVLPIALACALVAADLTAGRPVPHGRRVPFQPRGSRPLRGLVRADPVHLEPGHEGGPGAGHLEQADADQHGPADPGHQAGPPPGKGERPHRELEAKQHEQERDAQAERVDEREQRAARDVPSRPTGPARR